MKIVNSLSNSSVLNRFFEYSGRLLIIPLVLSVALLMIFYYVPSTFEYYYLLIAATWIYAVLFLGFDIPVSFFTGKTGTYKLKTDGPRVLVRGVAPPEKSYVIMLAIKCLIYICVIGAGIAYFQIFNQ